MYKPTACPQWIEVFSHTYWQSVLSNLGIFQNGMWKIAFLCSVIFFLLFLVRLCVFLIWLSHFQIFSMNCALIYVCPLLYLVFWFCFLIDCFLIVFNWFLLSTRITLCDGLSPPVFCLPFDFVFCLLSCDFAYSLEFLVFIKWDYQICCLYCLYFET